MKHYRKNVKLHFSLHVSLFYAAKALDQTISVCKELGDLREVDALAERAANMYMRHGSPETGAASLDKAAKILEQQYPEQALPLYMQAADIASVNNKIVYVIYE